MLSMITDLPSAAFRTKLSLFGNKIVKNGQLSTVRVNDRMFSQKNGLIGFSGMAILRQVLPLSPKWSSRCPMGGLFPNTEPTAANHSHSRAGLLPSTLPGSLWISGSTLGQHHQIQRARPHSKLCQSPARLRPSWQAPSVSGSRNSKHTK